MAVDDTSEEQTADRRKQPCYTQHDALYDELPQKFQNGFDVLAERPEVNPRLVTITDDDAPGGGNRVFISLGIFHVARFADYNHEWAEVFIRLHDQWPQGQKYGFATIPTLKVVGHGLPSNSEIGRDQAQPLVDALDGVNEVHYWSRKWNYMNIDSHGKGEQMRQAVPWVKRVLETPIQEDQ
jgi:hypothetical protein